MTLAAGTEQSVRRTVEPIAVVGAGYLGLVVAGCLAESGHRLICVDADRQRVAQLQSGRCPLYEPGLENVLRRNVASGRLSFSANSEEALAEASLVFVCVGTPSLPDGAVDLGQVMSVARQMASVIRERATVVIKSTVPVGTADSVTRVLSEAGRHHCEVVSVPEFIREGTAISDFTNPARVVIGTRTTQAAEQVLEVYRPFVREHTRVLVMDNRSAELTKYAANLALAARLSLINELARLADALGADIDLVRRAVGADPRIGDAYMLPGIGFGGSCLPKDVRALMRTGHEHGVSLRMPEAVIAANNEQVLWFVGKIRRHFQNALGGRRLTIWGLAFKPGTDDVREAPSLNIAEELLRQGAVVTVYDPRAMQNAREVLGNQVIYGTDQYGSLMGAEGLVVVTEWEEFRSADFKRMVVEMKTPVVFDGRNIYDPGQMREYGFVYYGVGRL